MPGAWRIVDLTGYEGKISAGKGSLYVGESTVPLADLAVILVGPHCLLHESVFDRAVAFDIAIMHCDWRSVPIATTITWSNNSRVATRQKCQIAMSIPRQKNAWMRIVQAKIRGQANVLSAWNRPHAAEIRDLAKLVRSGDPSNVEARAARAYWSAVLGEPRFRRQPGSRVHANSYLDYTYAILRGFCVRAVVSTGLNPTLGVWHHQRSNNFALIDDIIEPFRPAADVVALQAYKKYDSLTPDCKRQLASVCDRKFASNGWTTGSSITHFAQSLAIYIEGEGTTVDVPVFEGSREDG
ncbi:MAG: type II CRISPR-associated endonuclease Cas1 [Ferrimicrobium acidiphilum]